MANDCAGDYKKEIFHNWFGFAQRDVDCVLISKTYVYMHNSIGIALNEKLHCIIQRLYLHDTTVKIHPSNDIVHIIQLVE